MDAAAWCFYNMIRNIIAVDPHAVMWVGNDVAQAYEWLKVYNECGDVSRPGMQAKFGP